MTSSSLLLQGRSVCNFLEAKGLNARSLGVQMESGVFGGGYRGAKWGQGRSYQLKMLTGTH